MGKENQVITPLAWPVNDAAKLFGVSASHVWGLIRKGKLRAFKIGRRTLISQKEINRLLDGDA
jgi:excisionase family DNA binding protein